MAEYDIPVGGYGIGSNNNYPIPMAIPAPSISSTTSQQQYTNSYNSTAASHPSSSAARFQLNKAASESLITNKAITTLIEQGYSKGLAESLMTNKIAFPLRIWIVDNSGSMRNNDGNRIIVNAKRELKIVSGCSRWAEMQQTVEYHARIAALTTSPTIFRLLNDPGIIAGPQQFSIAQSSLDPSYIENELQIALQTISKTNPGGVTPLTQHIREIRQNVYDILPTLRQDGTKVAIIVATDGLPSDDQGRSNNEVKTEFESALQSLEGLPVWIVVRLCTDEHDVVDYWNNIDSRVELNIEVLDDFVSEATEICSSYNKWLNYGLPLHRIREMGFHNNLLDLLDERKLSKDEIYQFCRLLYGDGAFDGAPDPNLDWDKFYKFLDNVVTTEKCSKQWNPLRKRMEPWIDMKQLNKDYGTGGFFSFLW